MAKQAGALLLTGSIDNLSFYYNKEYGMLVRRKGGPDSERVKRDPRFAKTRARAEEFRQAVMAGKCLRISMYPLMRHVADAQLTARMNAAFVKVVQSDKKNPPGERSATMGDAGLLKGFEFNRRELMSEVTSKNSKQVFHYSTNMNYALGMMTVYINQFNPKKLQAPEGATHCRIGAIGAAIDFDKQDFSRSEDNSDMISLQATSIAAFTLHVHPAAETGHSLFLGLGVRFYKPNSQGGYDAIKGGMMAVVEAGKCEAVVVSPVTKKKYNSSLLNPKKSSIAQKAGGFKIVVTSQPLATERTRFRQKHPSQHPLHLRTSRQIGTKSYTAHIIEDG
jgi:hypothetical protein